MDGNNSFVGRNVVNNDVQITGDLNVDGNVSFGNLSIANINTGSITASNLRVVNEIATNISTTTLRMTGTQPSLNITNSFYQTNSTSGITFIHGTSPERFTRIRNLLTGANNADMTFSTLNSGNENIALCLQGGTSNVGIGTTSPSASLEIRSSTARRFLMEQPTLTTGNFLEFSNVNQTHRALIGLDGNGFTGFTGGRLIVGTWSNHPIGFFTNTVARMTISTAGNVSIGTTTPSSQNLDVRTSSTEGSMAIGNGLRLVRSQNSNFIQSGIDANSSGSAADLRFTNINNANTFMTLTSTGNLGIGTTSPAYQLELSTDSAAKPTTNTWTISSDIRLKENIEDANLDICYNVIKNASLKRFKWKDDYIEAHKIRDKHSLGFIADDIEKLYPKSVNKLGNKDGIENLKGMNIDQMIMSLFGAVQKLIDIVENGAQPPENKLPPLKQEEEEVVDEVVEEGGSAPPRPMLSAEGEVEEASTGPPVVQRRRGRPKKNV